MSELQLFSYGGPDCLKFVSDTVVPTPKDDEVQLKVMAAGVNVIDTKIRKGTSFAARARGNNFPWVLGFDVAGEVMAVPNAEVNWQKGDRVCGLVGFAQQAGAYCSVGCFKANELARVPDSVGMREAAALPLAGLTAWQALFEVGCLKPGETVIISAGAGGVGHLAVQLATLAGAKVYAIASKKNHAFLKSLGALDVCEYHEDEYLRWQSEADLIIDLVGGQSAISSLSLLKINSRMVSVPTVTFQAVRLAASNLSSEVLGMVVRPDVQQLEHLLQLVAEGKLRVCVSDALALKDGALAHKKIEAGHTLGKIVLIPE